MRDLGLFVHCHHPYSMPPDVSLSRFPTEMSRLNPEPGFTNPLPSQHRHPNEGNISQNLHSHMCCLDNTFPLYYGLGRRIIPVPPLEKSLGSRPHVRFRPSWAPNHLTAPHDYYTEDGSGDLTKDESGEDTEELDALLCSDDDSSDDDVASTGRSPAEEIGDEDYGFVGPAAKRRRTGVQSLSCDEGSRREKVGRALQALRSVVPGGRGKDGIAVIDEAIEYLRSLKGEMKTMGLNTR